MVANLFRTAPGSMVKNPVEEDETAGTVIGSEFSETNGSSVDFVDCDCL